MENRYINILSRLTVDQLEREARRVRDVNPRKAALVYSELIDKAEDFNDKLYYQQLADRFESLSNQHLRNARRALQEGRNRNTKNTEIA